MRDSLCILSLFSFILKDQKIEFFDAIQPWTSQNYMNFFVECLNILKHFLWLLQALIDKNLNTYFI